MLDSEQISLTQSALLVIDVQNSFLVGERWARHSNLHFEERLAQIVELYRKARLPIIFILHHDQDPGFRVGDHEVALMAFLDRRSYEPLLYKHTRNCFTSTMLLPLLLERGVRRLLITGIQTEQCCETTARLAADYGFAVDFVTECTRTFPIPNWDRAGEELDTDAIIERTEYALHRRFARIRTVREIAEELAIHTPGSIASI
jgi:nicotinamidase-related amidase